MICASGRILWLKGVWGLPDLGSPELSGLRTSRGAGEVLKTVAPSTRKGEKGLLV